MDINETVLNIAKQAKNSARILSNLRTEKKNRVLNEISQNIILRKSFLQQENQKDLEEAKRLKLSPAMIDRLFLSDKIIDEMAQGLKEVSLLPDPVGQVEEILKRPNGLAVGKMRIPIGVIGMIYESRPNVTVDAAGLCLKAGNSVVLRGGKEAINSNLALAHLIQDVLESENIPRHAVQVVPITDRSAVFELLKQKDYIDVIIPRGGESLIKTVYENSNIPVIAHYKGVCHVFIDKSAEPETAKSISLNSKIQRPGVCNAMETLLVHEGFAVNHLETLINSFKNKGVKIKGCEKTVKLVKEIESATEADWYEEYLDLILSVRVVKNIEEAIEHISCYGSKHTEAIVTSDYKNSQKFLSEVDSSVVLVNASTRFNDGNQLGLGAEIGISTSKLHAFGPMGLRELTTAKFIVYGDGQIRE